MSYTPGTKLSFKNGSECATVLTNNMVMATMVQGALSRERMPLADWLILAEGQETVVMSESGAIWATTIEKAKHDEAEAAAWANVSHAGAMWTAARERIDAEATYPERPLRTKLKWVDNEMSSTVIVTKNGFLEVKRTTANVQLNAAVPKTLYTSEAEWRATLPNSGVITVTPPTPTLIAQKLAPLPEGLSDIEKIEELSKRFDYNPKFSIHLSKKMEVEIYEKSIEEMKESLALASGKKAFQIAGAINRLTSYVNNCREKLNEMTETEQNFRTMAVYCLRGKSSILIDIKGVEQLIGVYTNPNGEKSIAYNGIPWNLNAKTFQDLGLTGFNKLSVVYRNTTYIV